jgi:hypothetical protein
MQRAALRTPTSATSSEFYPVRIIEFLLYYIIFLFPLEKINTFCNFGSNVKFRDCTLRVPFQPYLLHA